MLFITSDQDPTHATTVLAYLNPVEIGAQGKRHKLCGVSQQLNKLDR